MNCLFLDGIVPDCAWYVMYAWYRQMYVTMITLSNKVSSSSSSSSSSSCYHTPAVHFRYIQRANQLQNMFSKYVI